MNLAATSIELQGIRPVNKHKNTLHIGAVLDLACQYIK